MYTTAIHTIQNKNERRERIIANNRARRVRQLRRRCLLATLFTVFGLSILLGSGFAKAQNSQNQDKVKCYSSVMIGYGEDLNEVIAKHYNGAYYTSLAKYQKEVYEINSLSEESQITPGNYIVVPIYH